MVSEPSMASSNTQNHTGFSNTSFHSSSSSMQAPLLILSNMSNLMSVKLDSSNFIVWKHQLSSILKAYSMIDFVDGTVPSPSQFLTDAEGNLTSAANPEFKIWNTRDQALLTLINSTLSTPVLSMVVGHNSAQAVWKTLEQRFTSTSRANVLNLKIELHNLKKGGESVNSYLQKVKNTRDKLVAVGILIDNEELLHIILKGLPREYGPFCSAIRTRNEPVSFEEIMVLLQTEELSLVECSDSGKDLQAMALFASTTPNNRNFNSQSSFYVNNSQSRGRGRSNSQRGRGGRFNNHNQYSSPSQGQSTSSQHSQNKPEGSRPQCQICGKLGHQALDCYHRMDFAYQGRHPPAKLAAMASTSNGAQAGESWLTDTGATDHLTANMNNLNTHTSYQGTEQVAVGNGQSIPINNIGTVHKLCKDNHCSCYFDSNKFLIQDLPSGKSALCNTPVTSTFDSSPWLLVMLHNCSVQHLTPPAESVISSPSLVTVQSPTVPIVELSPPSPHPTPSAESSTPSAESAESAASVSAESPIPSVSAEFSTPASPSQTTSSIPVSAASHIPDPATLAPAQPPSSTYPSSTSTTTSGFPTCPYPSYADSRPEMGFSNPNCIIPTSQITPIQNPLPIKQLPNILTVVKPPTVRLILALAVTYNWPLKQLDVRNAFLHGILKEEVYMQQPTGYVDSTHPTHVCQLHKSIYGLKQAPRAWFESFTTQLLTLGFQPSSADSSLFIYKDGPIIAFLLLYVDDIVLTGNNSFFLSQLITSLSQVFELKDMGKLHYFLGLQITRSSQGLTLTQTKYATDLLTKHNMLNCSPCKTPCVPNTRLSTTCGKPLFTDVHAYRSLVGALHYLTFTRPDLSFAVHQVCQFMQAPTDIHLTAAKRILRYVRGTIDNGLFYTPGPIFLFQLSPMLIGLEIPMIARAPPQVCSCFLATILSPALNYLWQPLTEFMLIVVLWVLFITHLHRPDLSFAVHQVCQFMKLLDISYCCQTHPAMSGVPLTMVYSTLQVLFLFQLSPMLIGLEIPMIGSTSGLLVFLGNNPITWSAKKNLQFQILYEAESEPLPLPLLIMLASYSVFNGSSLDELVSVRFQMNLEASLTLTCSPQEVDSGSKIQLKSSGLCA
uniref:CCHC-type domain-containing protein n=1 Tax=Fagus sylvatica TaxID=28930 RepID=A0A2N9HY44_FAGSY